MRITAEQLNFDATVEELKSGVRFPNVHKKIMPMKGNDATTSFKCTTIQAQTGYTDAKLPQPFSDSGARGFQYSFVETRPLFRAGAVKRNGAKINLE